VVHAALEWSARNGWQRPPAELLAVLLRREGLAGGGDAAERCERLIAGWLESALLAELGRAAVRPEVPFVVGLAGTVVRGQIDLLVAGAGGEPTTVIDYKTDALDGRSGAELASRYRAQREVYGLAAGQAEEVRVAHVFLEAPDEPVVELLDRERLASARARLERTVGAMTAGRFEVTAEPYPALCFGCPAARRLCPRPAWRPAA
jgi:ATP-dependent exoDNAse (exonuclease V) beta subunit